MCEYASRKRQRARIKHKTVIPERRKTKNPQKKRPYSTPPPRCNNCSNRFNHKNTIKTKGGSSKIRKRRKHRNCNFPLYKFLCMVLLMMLVTFIAFSIFREFPPLLANPVLEIIKSSLNIVSKIFDILKLLYDGLQDF